jgi:hypothetical protein
LQLKKPKEERKSNHSNKRYNMKTKFLLALGVSLVHLSFCLPSWGQYSIPWYKMAGGGGTSTNGPFALTGTIGQADASQPMSGGSFSLTGGFWSFLSVVPTPGAPTLYISSAGNIVTIFWQDVSGWSLQQNDNLSLPANWSASTGVSNANGTNYLTLTSPPGNMFFRLEHP